MDIFKNLVKEFEKAHETCGYASFTFDDGKFFTHAKIMVESLETDEDSIYVVGENGSEFEIKDGDWKYDQEGDGEYILDDLCVLVLPGRNT